MNSDTTGGPHRRPLRVAFACETTLGNRSHLANLQRGLAGRDDVAPVWLPIDERADDVWQRLPLLSRKLSLVGGLRTRAALVGARASGALDAALIHTQRMAHLCRGFMSTTPTVVSMDATPQGLESYLRVYGMPSQHRGMAGRLKYAINRGTYLAARHVIAFSEFTRRSLLEDYRLPPDHVSVIPVGVDTALWRPAEEAERPQDGVVRIVFVGGDWRRKGGELLLRWARETAETSWELHLVTAGDVPSGGRIFVHKGLGANSRGITELVRRCDIFVLPTFADMSPIAVIEAKASGLPVVATRTGGVAELVDEGVDGYLVDPGDFSALRERLDHLVVHAEERQRMGRAARAVAVANYDGVQNAGRVLEVLRGCAR